MIVKVCGVTTAEDAAAAAAAGVDWIGINFWPRSKRYVTPVAARAIVEAARTARADLVVVGVFVDAPGDLVAETAGQLALDRVQLHGNEPAAYCSRFRGRYLKALPGNDDTAERAAAYDCDVVLVDAAAPGYGGTGVVADWAAARAVVASGRRVLLAGGLTPDNVAAAIAQVGPWGVDVASGVEALPRRKDADRMRRFVAAAKEGS